MAVSQSEVVVLVHSWLIQQGFKKTASCLAVEAKYELQTISVNGSIRNLNDILSDYTKLKQKEIDNNKIQDRFYNDNQENENIFIDIWNQFNSLINDYKYFKKKNYDFLDEYEQTKHNKYKRRRKQNNNFELNTNRFHEILENNELHEKMAKLIQENNKNKKMDNDVIDQMMNEYQFDELFIPLPITTTQQPQQQEEKEKDNNNNNNTNNNDNNLNQNESTKIS